MDVLVIGAGPAGLMAAEVLASRGRQVTIFDSKPELSIKKSFLYDYSESANKTDQGIGDKAAARRAERCRADRWGVALQFGRVGDAYSLLTTVKGGSPHALPSATCKPTQVLVEAATPSSVHIPRPGRA